MEGGIINGALYEDGSEYLGWANVTLPDFNSKMLTVNGAGIPGDVDIPVKGHYDAPTAAISFTDASANAHKLAEQRLHIVDLRVAHEEYDSTTGSLVTHQHKHILKLFPKSVKGGTVAPAAGQGASNEYTVMGYKLLIDGAVVRDYDPVNFKDVGADGVDNLADVRAALGK